MFRCHFCDQVTPPGTKKHNVVVATREKAYPSRRSEGKRQGRFRMRNEQTSDAGGKGVETMKEVPACPACATKQEAVTPTPVEAEVATPLTEVQDPTSS